MAKKATKSISEDGSILSFEFHEDGVDALSATITELDEEIIARLAMHGLSAKMGDSYAGVEKISECREAANRVWEDLVAKNWTTRVAGAGGPRITQLAEALSRVAMGRGKELTVDQAVTAVDAMPDEQKKALRKVPAIKEAIAQIKIERLQAETSVEATEADNSALDALLGA